MRAAGRWALVSQAEITLLPKTRIGSFAVSRLQHFYAVKLIARHVLASELAHAHILRAAYHIPWRRPNTLTLQVKPFRLLFASKLEHPCCAQPFEPALKRHSAALKGNNSVTLAEQFALSVSCAVGLSGASIGPS